MQIQPNANSISHSSQTKTTDTPKVDTANVVTEKSNESIYQQSQKLQNLAVLNASNDNSVANNPMSLLYKTAIEEINKLLAPEFGENAAQSAYDSGLDVSPEATADRIIKGSTAFYEAFKTQNSELSEEESINAFIDVISQGIETGFAEAKDILESLSVLEEEIETNIDLTYNFVQQGITSFKEQFLANLTEQKSSQDKGNDQLDNSPSSDETLS